MQNPILSLIEHPDWLFLFSVYAVSPVNRYSLGDWNEAISSLASRHVYLPSLRAVERYLAERICSHEAYRRSCIS